MYLRKYNNDKATLCSDKNCIIVYGQTARVVNTIIVFVVAIVAIGYIAKALR